MVVSTPQRSFKTIYKTQGIHHELTLHESLKKNGVAERKNRTLVETARCMLSHVKLTKMFWAEAIATAVYTQNKLPTSALKRETPFKR